VLGQVDAARRCRKGELVPQAVEARGVSRGGRKEGRDEGEGKGDALGGGALVQLEALCAAERDEDEADEREGAQGEPDPGREDRVDLDRRRVGVCGRICIRYATSCKCLREVDVPLMAQSGVKRVPECSS